MHARAYKLSLEEFDSTTGTVVWPEILQAEKFTVLRTKIDRLFESRLHYGDAESSQAIVHTTARLKHELRRDADNFELADYRGAQKFLLGLQFEAEFGQV